MEIARSCRGSLTATAAMRLLVLDVEVVVEVVEEVEEVEVVEIV